MGAEIGATTSLFPYNNRMYDYLAATKRKHVGEFSHAYATELREDEGAEYDELIEINLAELEPHINGPFTPDLATPISNFKEAVKANKWPEEVRVGLIGSCTNSRIEDLRAVRQVLSGMPNRPAILRKEFVFEEYQILEARLAGADTVLLIVKMLDEELLTRLYKYSTSLGMEPLVEVQNAEEMATAVKLGSKVIGVNNRNLESKGVVIDIMETIRTAAENRERVIVKETGKRAKEANG